MVLIVYVTSLVYRNQLMDFQRRERTTAESRKILLSILSHDVAQPLTVATTLAVDLNNNAANNTPALRAELLSSLERANSLLDRVRHLLRVLAGSEGLTLQKISIAVVIDDVIKLYQSQANSKRIKLVAENIHRDMVVETDPLLVKHSVIGNLLSNALKFSPEGSTVELQSRIDGERWIIRIIDCGLGISNVLEMNRAHQSVAKSSLGTAGERGSGLGLFIAKSVSHRFGGQMIISEPSTGRPGTVIEVIFPVKFTQT